MPSETAPQTPPSTVALAIREDGWRELGERTSTRTVTAMADRLGVNISTVSRVLNGKTAPTGDFVARTLATFDRTGYRFDDLFRWVRAS